MGFDMGKMVVRQKTIIFSIASGGEEGIRTLDTALDRITV
jgi:hypothetical protein